MRTAGGAPVPPAPPAAPDAVAPEHCPAYTSSGRFSPGM